MHFTPLLVQQNLCFETPSLSVSYDPWKLSSSIDIIGSPWWTCNFAKRINWLQWKEDGLIWLVGHLKRVLKRGTLTYSRPARGKTNGWFWFYHQAGQECCYLTGLLPFLGAPTWFWAICGSISRDPSDFCGFDSPPSQLLDIRSSAPEKSGEVLSAGERNNIGYCFSSILFADTLPIRFSVTGIVWSAPSSLLFIIRA